MKKTEEKPFHTVEFFRTVKEKIAKLTSGKSLEETQFIWQQIREGKIKIA